MSCISGKALSRHHSNPPYSPLLLSLLGTSFGRDARLIRARFERVREGGSFTNASVGGTGGRVKEAAGGAGAVFFAGTSIDLTRLGLSNKARMRYLEKRHLDIRTGTAVQSQGPEMCEALHAGRVRPIVIFWLLGRYLIPVADFSVASVSKNQKMVKFIFSPEASNILRSGFLLLNLVLD